MRAWQEHCQRLYSDYTSEVQRRQAAEQKRQAKLADARAVYDQACRQRERDSEAQNERLTQFINDLAFDVESAIQEYVGIILSNSVYPDVFPAVYDHAFDLGSRELTLTVTIPEPGAIPVVKEYRYIKAKDEITRTSLPAREQKDRYANAVWQVAVRTLHEVFEADRAGKIRSIALTVGVDRIAPATGLPEQVCLVVAGADRETFTSFDLANVVPSATLDHLGAAMSKSPFDLTPADSGPGVRRRVQ